MAVRPSDHRQDDRRRDAATLTAPPMPAVAVRWLAGGWPTRDRARRRLAVGAISAAVTMNGSIRRWYRTLDVPSWNPPDWVFGPVWTTLYVMMGVALVQVVRSEPRSRLARQIGLGLFAFQLLLNFGWSWIFFVNHDLGGALVEILALWLAIAATIAAFAVVRPRGRGAARFPTSRGRRSRRSSPRRSGA